MSIGIYVGILVAVAVGTFIITKVARHLGSKDRNGSSGDDV